MVTVPAFVWRFGFLDRAVTMGLGFALPLAALAWIDSGVWFAAIIVVVILVPCYGFWMARRMSRFWPEAVRLSSEDRVAVAQTARRGEALDESRLAQPVIEYSRGLHASAEKAVPFRWLVWLVLTVGVGVALWDNVFGTAGNGIASSLYVLLLLLELFWWPRQQRQLLANADRAAVLAHDALLTSGP